MRVGIATVQVPFISGGAESHAYGLERAIRDVGHDVEVISMPFRFTPASEVRRSMDIWEGENFEHMNGYIMDLVICLKFPTYYLQHPMKIVWILHQHRAVYDLWDTPFSDHSPDTAEGWALKRDVHERDTRALASCKRIYGNSKRVSARLLEFNGIESTPLYHPPPLADRFYTGAPEPYIFFPSRLEDPKRQHLLIAAMAHVRSPVVALLAGEGGKKHELQRMIEQFGLSQRVRLLGRIGNDDLLAYYANCLGVFFGPYDEDYGYVALEAMLAAKPVITCTDAGGPLEFVLDKETGCITDPRPEEVAQAIDELFQNKQRAIEMGKAGFMRYQDMNISWKNVLETLLFVECASLLTQARE